MKKLIKILSLLLIFTLTFTMLAACKKEEKSKDSDPEPNKNPEKAKEALEEAEYDVVFADGDLADLAATILGIEKVDVMISASKGDDMIEIIYFEDSDAAKEHFETLKKQMEESLEEEDKTFEIKRSDYMVYYGTTAAIKAAE